jgi:hypothetical protein
MKGSGAVRDLREASMLNAELKTLLATYSQAQTREEQMGLLDKLIAEWAKSANYQTFDKRIDALDEGSTDVRFQYSWEAAGAAPTDAQKSTQQLLERIKALEVFNGQNFLRFGKVGATANSLTLSFGMGTTNGTTTYAIKDGSVVINENRLGLNAGQTGLLNRAYEALRNSIYEGLLLQTRLKPYIDRIGLSITDAGIALDYSEMTKLFEQTAVTSPLKAFNDALDLSLAWKGDTSSGLAFGQIAVNLFERLSDEDLQKVRQRTEEAGYRFIFGDQSGNALTGSGGNDRIFGGAGNDTLQGGSGLNQLYGGDGDDTLSNDIWYSDNNLYVGGKGNDVLNGTNKRDTYFFELGDGHDVINELGGEDVLRFGADINSTDLWLQRTGNNLELSVLGSDDKVTISNWYASTSNHVETIKTADGKTLLDSQVQNLVNAMAAFAPPTAGNSNLTPEQRAQLEVVIAANWQ